LEKIMGKATELDNYLRTQVLTPAEAAARRVAREIAGDDIEITPDGALAKRVSPSEPPKVLKRLPQDFWE
jgi:hypothetical protein